MRAIRAIAKDLDGAGDIKKEQEVQLSTLVDNITKKGHK
jgi:hypothetical protein